jgi:hypothetical protein
MNIDSVTTSSVPGKHTIKYTRCQIDDIINNLSTCDTRIGVLAGKLVHAYDNLKHETVIK